MKTFLYLLLAGGLAAPLAHGQLKITGLDGLASKAKEAVDISLDPTMLKLASGFLSSNDKSNQQLKSVLDGIKGITVKSFEFDKEGQYRMEDLEPIRAQLRTPGWNKIINVQSKDEVSEIYTRMDQGKVVGLAIIAAEPKELSVIAIDGTIDLSDLSKLGALGVPPINVPDQSKGKKKGKQE